MAKLDERQVRGFAQEKGGGNGGIEGEIEV
jgi:hypothetical protein